MTAFTLTDHATAMLRERLIDPAWVEKALLSPDESRPDGADPDLLHRIARIPEAEGRVLRVVASRTEPYRVVTVFFDRRLRNLTV